MRDIYNLKVPNIRGNNVPLGSVAKINRIIGPSRVSRFNLYPCAEIIGALERGHSTGEAIAEIEKIASEVLPDGMGIEWTDLAFQEKRMGNTSIYIFALCVIFVYLMLVALYEDWKLPLSVILVVPLAYGVDAGAELREALGTSVLYGMIGVSFLGLIFTPAFYYAIQRNKKYAVKDTE